jgi:hypothetical protein
MDILPKEELFGTHEPITVLVQVPCNGFTGSLIIHVPLLQHLTVIWHEQFKEQFNITDKTGLQFPMVIGWI